MQALSDAPHPGVQVFQHLFSRIDRLQSALTQQQNSFEDFMLSYNAQQKVAAAKLQAPSPPPETVTPAPQSQKRPGQDASTQTPLAQAPPQPPQPPPPVRIRQSRPDNKPSQPSPLSRSSSIDDRVPFLSPNVQSQQQNIIANKVASPKPRTPLDPFSKQSTPTGPLSRPRTPSSAKVKTADNSQKKVGFSLPANDAALKERKAAFAAMTAAVPKSASKPKTAHAIAAAQRELERGATRSKIEAEREK